MENYDKQAFISMTFDNYKDENLEYLQKEGKKRNEEIKSYTSNSNKIIQLISLFVVIIFVGFLLPLIVSGLFTKSWSFKYQSTYLLIIVITICFHLLKKTLM